MKFLYLIPVLLLTIGSSLHAQEAQSEFSICNPSAIAESTEAYFANLDKLNDELNRAQMQYLLSHSDSSEKHLAAINILELTRDIEHLKIERKNHNLLVLECIRSAHLK